jgi:DNA-binding response OmpR family regulator
MSGEPGARYAGWMQIPRRTFQQGGFSPSSSAQPIDESTSTLPLVLIVEDDGSVRHLLAQALSSTFAVTTARDGLEGLGLAFVLRPALVLCDVQMPVMNGLDFLVEFRKNLALASTPVVMLTGFLDEELELELRHKGADDYLSKPCSVDTLIERVGRAIERARLAAAEAETEPSELVPPTERSAKGR